MLSDGAYSLIVSTFEPSQTGKYDLSIECDLPVSLRAIPAEGAGMFSRTVSRAWLVLRLGICYACWVLILGTQE